MRRSTRFLLNAVLAITSAGLTIVALNFVFSAFALHLINQHTFPRALITYLGDHYHTFYPAVNDRTFRNWNAVLGDSHATGIGDAFLQNKPAYGWMHFLRIRNKENYYIFGRSGFGSINAAREFIITTDEIRNRIFYPRYGPPRKLLFLFYEGNDLNNNLDHISRRGSASQSIHDFVEAEIGKPVEAGRRNRVSYPLLLLLRDIYRDGHKLLSDLQQHTAQPEPNSAKNHVIIGGKTEDFPHLPQSAAAELSEAQIDSAMEVVFEAIRYLKHRLPTTTIEIVYLPSIATVYEWEDPIYFETYHTDKLLSTSWRSNLARSKDLRGRLAEFSSREGLGFIDTSDELIASGRLLLLHGPLDSRHLNETGQQIVGETIHRKELALANGAAR